MKFLNHFQASARTAGRTGRSVEPRFRYSLQRIRVRRQHCRVRQQNDQEIDYNLFFQILWQKVSTNIDSCKYFHPTFFTTTQDTFIVGVSHANSFLLEAVRNKILGTF